MRHNRIVFLDSEWDIVEETSADNTSDFILAVARELSRTRGEEITPYYATVLVGDKYTDRIHK